MPKNEGALGAGDKEMTSAARMHGQPLLRLNHLTRFYLVTAFVTLSLIPLTVLFHGLGWLSGWLTTVDVVYVIANLLTASLLLFAGGISIKFLPSSMGGNPHVYSLTMALWSYWFIVFGALLGIFAPLIENFSTSGSILYTEIGYTLYGGITFVGAVMLLVNLSKTMEKRV